MDREERQAVAATRTARQIAVGNPYGLADAVQRDREQRDEIERWRHEQRLIWQDVRRCGECQRSDRLDDLDRPVWRHCLHHLTELTEHMADRPW